MKKQPKPRAKKRAKKKLPAPMSGLACEDLLWDFDSPVAPEIFEYLQAEPPTDEYWATVSGVAVYVTSLREAWAAKAAYEGTAARVLRRLRKKAWLYREDMATGNAIRLWTALSARLVSEYPEATPGQLWVLLRDALRVLRNDFQLVDADGR